MLRNYIYTALRNLVRFKTNSVINIIGLSLGFATAIIIVLYVIHEFQIDKFNKNIDRIYRIELGEEKNRHAYMPEIVARKISEEIPEV
jgi:putative ABC transport system permease protein